MDGLSLVRNYIPMQRLLFSLFALFLLIRLDAQTGTAPATADEVLRKAIKTAARDNKKVLLMFHASWCGWCHRMDSSLSDPSCRKFFDDNFVITHLVVDESAANKNLENPGAAEMRTRYHGDGVGIPFWLIFDKNGTLLADSKIRKNGETPEGGNNIGCPANEDEVAYFIELLKKFTPLQPDQLAIIARRFRQNAL